MDRLDNLPDEVVRDILADVELLERKQHQERCRIHFLDFVKTMWPAFIDGAHFRIMANAFERIAAGKLKRLMIHMPPRHGKSKFSSEFFPAWYMGQFPDRKIIMASHTQDLAEGFGRDVRNLVNSIGFRRIFPGVMVSADSKAAGRWNTSKRGSYYAIGTQGALAGRGADLFVLDDAHDEQQAVSAETNPGAYDADYEWFTSGPIQRLQPDGAICITSTRWSKRDIPGRIMQSVMEMESPEHWEIIEFPAIMPDGTALWPEYWPIDKLLSKKASMPPHKWEAQYQQNPTANEVAIIKREWWKMWEPATLLADKVCLNERGLVPLNAKGVAVPPHCEYIIQSWDTAHTRKTRSDFSACTTWGIFTPRADAPDAKHIILLNAWTEKLEFPDLKARARLECQRWKPDKMVIEAKAAGWPLIQELRQGGIPCEDYSPGRGEDKFVRLNSVSDLLKSGMVWVPPRDWAREVIEQVASMGTGDHDDLVDCVSLALMRFRQGGFVRLPGDFEEKKEQQVRRVREYY